MARKLIGIRRKNQGWQAFVRVNGRLYTKQFALETPLTEMREWREDQIEAFAPRAVPGSFAANVATYLEKPEIAAMPSLANRRAHLELWLAALGRDRRLETITRDDVERVLQAWLQQFSSVTVYHRRTALSSFFRALHGEQGCNPVRGTTKPEHWHPIDRSVDFATLTRIIAAMPDTRVIKPGIRGPSFAKLAARAIWHTGIPPAELVKLRRVHFEREAAKLRLPWRDKGEGRPPYRLPLSDEAVAVFVDIEAADAWGTFPAEEAMSRSFKRAARRILGPHTPVRLYDLRHSLGADLYRRTGDLPTVGRLLGHVEGSIVTAQYALGAQGDVDQAAIAAVSAARTASLTAPAAVPGSVPKVASKVAHVVKPRRIKHLQRA